MGGIIITKEAQKIPLIKHRGIEFSFEKRGSVELGDLLMKR